MIYLFKKTAIFYEITGEGPALVLLHGFLESSTMWKDALPSLEKSYTVITLDFPGHGKSKAVDTIHTMELLAEVVCELLTHLGILSVHIVGHSMGGYAALAFVEKYPDKASSIILLNSTTFEDSLDRKKNRTRAIEIIRTNKKAFVSMAISNLFSEASRLDFASEINELKTEALTFSEEGIIACIEGMKDRKDRTDVLLSFKKPKYIICGSEDVLIPLEVSKSISEKTNTPLKIIDSGHMSLLEGCKKIIKILLLILK